MRPVGIVLLLFLNFVLYGCANQQEQALPRAAPGYLHWIQQQSMLGSASALIAQVSQSSRVWLMSGEASRVDVMLAAAPTWLELAGQPADPKKPFFRELSREIGAASQMGFYGVYFGQTGEKPDIWTSREGTPSRKAISFAFDASFGSDEDFEKLAEQAEAAGMQLGSDLPGGATGRGPDFFLQARNAPEHGGLYAMLPVPEEAHDLLPVAREEWDCAALSQGEITRLADMGIVPEKIARDSLVWASAGGWACTGPVVGADGNVRRWLYRYSGSPDQPVLSWQDPSGQAARILSAAAIKQTGLLGESLAGLSFEPLMGLEPGNSLSLSPGLAALNEMSRQIHRYGGWAIQIDPLPLRAIQDVINGPCDFCRDDITALLVMFGLVNADGRPLAQLYRDWISRGFDISRLARGFNAVQGLSPRLLADNPEWQLPGQRLAELGVNVGVSQVFNAVFADAPTRENADAMLRFLLSWRIGLPGLAFVEFYPDSLLQHPDDWLVRTLLARKTSGVANGKVISVIRGRGGGFGLLTELPEHKGYWLLACNFGRMRDELHVDLPRAMSAANDVGSETALNAGLSGRSFRVALDGREARNILLQTEHYSKASDKPRRKP